MHGYWIDFKLSSPCCIVLVIHILSLPFPTMFSKLRCKIKQILLRILLDSLLYMLGKRYYLPTLVQIDLQWTIIFVVLQISYEADSRSFATDTFCFISIEKGMALNYMIPISGLMILTTIVSVSGVKEINSHLSKLEANVSLESLLRIEAADKTTGRTISELKAFRSCFKLLCVTQTSYGVVWFASIIALENVSYSNVMPFAYMLTSALLVSTFVPKITLYRVL